MILNIASTVLVNRIFTVQKKELIIATSVGLGFSKKCSSGKSLVWLTIVAIAAASLVTTTLVTGAVTGPVSAKSMTTTDQDQIEKIQRNPSYVREARKYTHLEES
ncbi:hypothetical protein BJ742DRAFT_740182 [Cladochytrium replicatum]|nr:hypothetical protein BJ742DRAFT_740182 [Cladochytrium replicatum]